jgi:hypothetical protein
MESKTFVDMNVGASYIMHITPEKHSERDHFELTVEVRWILSSPEKFSVGFMAIRGNNRAFEKYVDYLKEHHHHQRRAG